MFKQFKVVAIVAAFSFFGFAISAEAQARFEDLVDILPEPSLSEDIDRDDDPRCAFSGGSGLRYLPFVCLDSNGTECFGSSQQFGWIDAFSGQVVPVAWFIPNGMCQMGIGGSSGDLLFDVEVQPSGALCGCLRTRQSGCLAPDSAIRMADGTEKAASEVFAGDYVWNPVTKAPAQVIRVIESLEADPMIELSYGGQIAEVTTTHPVLTPTGMKAARDLKQGDLITLSDGSSVPLKSTRELPIEEGQWVVNFYLENSSSEDPSKHFLVANGLSVGDMILQLALSN